MFSSACFAQSVSTPPATSAPSGISLSTSSEATALDYAGVWSPATHVTESFDFADFGKTKSNHLFIEGHQLIATGAGFNSYLGGFRLAPDISKLLAKSNVPATNFGIYFNAAVGNTLFSNSDKSNFTELAGGGIQYNLTKSLTWSSLHANWLRVGGINGIELSTGLQYVFTH